MSVDNALSEKKQDAKKIKTQWVNFLKKKIINGLFENQKKRRNYLKEKKIEVV